MPGNGARRTGLTYEVCVDSVAGALAAEEAGADRVELCSALFEGGVTPSLALVEQTLRRVSRIRVHPIVRPRGGDFVYDPDEVALMRRDIELFRTAGVPGVVTGALTPAGAVDVEVLRLLLSAADGLSTTFHRAFDLVADPLAALETLIGCGVDRVLTSGQEASALEGAPRIAELVSVAAGRITVLAGAGVTERNVARIVAQTGVTEVHFSAGEMVDSPMVYRNSRPHLGGRTGPAEYARKLTTTAAVRRVLRAPLA